MVAAVGLAGVAGVLVLDAERLDEAHLRQRPGLRLVQELLLVLQVVGPAGVPGAYRAKYVNGWWCCWKDLSGQYG